MKDMFIPLLILAHSPKVSKIPEMESSDIFNKKQLESCGFGVPELNKVGDACEMIPCDR